MKALNFSQFKSKNKESLRAFMCYFMTILATLIYCAGVIWFLEPIQLYSGGVTGTAQLINSILTIVFHVNFGKFNFLGVLVLVLNIPILIYGWKAISKRFVIASIISIAIQTVLMSGFIPTPDFIINTGENPLTGIVVPGAGEEMDVLLLVLLGAIVTGFGSALALRYGGSTGGVDVLCLTVAFKHQISIGYSSFIINTLIAIGGAIVYSNPAIAIYSIVRIIINSLVVDKVHTSYNYLKIEIITDKADVVCERLFNDVNRGITEYHAVGAYTKQGHEVLETIVSSYEVHQVVDEVRQMDPQAFIIVSPANRVFGKFNKKTVA